MTNTNITEARKKLFELVNNVIDFNGQINIATKKGNVVLMSEEEYNGLTESVYLLSVPGMREKLLKAKAETDLIPLGDKRLEELID
jgi:PHD/YefM family antitoxin component YafN of YafNO toxin-antitoxin module